MLQLDIGLLASWMAMQGIIKYSWLKKIFEWIAMTFGLKNVGATYQRAMNFIFHEFIDTLLY